MIEETKCRDGELYTLIKELDKRIAQRFEAIERAIKLELTAVNQARELASKELDRRLDHLNNLYAQSQDDRARYFTIQEHNYFRDMVESRLKAGEQHAVEDAVKYLPMAEHKSFTDSLDKRFNELDRRLTERDVNTNQRFQGIEKWQYSIAGGISLIVFLVAAGALISHFWTIAAPLIKP